MYPFPIFSVSFPYIYIYIYGWLVGWLVGSPTPRWAALVRSGQPEDGDKKRSPGAQALRQNQRGGGEHQAVRTQPHPATGRREGTDAQGKGANNPSGIRMQIMRLETKHALTT